MNHAGRAPQALGSDRRICPRTSFSVPVDYLASGRVYRDYVRNVSLEGASIGGRDFFIPGERISISFPSANSPNQINGEIVWVDTDAFGIVFKSVCPKCKELSIPPLEPVEEHPVEIKLAIRKGGKIKRKRIRWHRSAGPDVITYRLYWSADAEVDYDSQYVDLGNVEEAVLPDDIPFFPLITGTLNLGLTALSKAGNESDMTRIALFLDFTVPEAPKQLWLEE